MPNSKKMAVNTPLLSVSFSEYSGYVMSLGDAIELIKEYEVNTTTTFTVAYQTKGLGNRPVHALSYIIRARWREIQRFV